MKQTGSVKGVALLAERIEVAVPLFANVSGALPTLCFLGNAFFQWGKSVTSSKEGKISRG